MGRTLSVAPHPLLDAGVFITRFSSPLSELVTPDAVQALIESRAQRFIELQTRGIRRITSRRLAHHALEPCFRPGLYGCQRYRHGHETGLWILALEQLQRSTILFRQMLAIGIGFDIDVTELEHRNVNAGETLIAEHGHKIRDLGFRLFVVAGKKVRNAAP